MHLQREHPVTLVRRGIFGSIVTVVVFAFVSTACTETKVVFKERELFEQPPDSVHGFLGYFDVARKTPTCGNCHVGQTGEWRGTAHADAWQGLQASGAAQRFCEGCHAVSERGNSVDTAAGINLVRHERYYDVQCESCHGPGLAHVENPDFAPAPLAQAAVGVDLTSGCGECHAGAHHPFVEEWSQSPHARVVTVAAGRAECAGCHRGQAVLTAWGENAEYVEKGSATHLPIVCVVCHDPHSARHPGQLRFPVNTVSIEEHLCARCHNRRTAPDPASRVGLHPHAPEAALLVGDAGWFPPGANIDQGQIRGTHGSGANPTLCARCHLPRFEVTDTAGNFVLQTTGHLFRPIPCVDAQGIPLPFQDECELSPTARSFVACTGAGCHGDQQAAFSALTAASTRIQRLSNQLLSQLQQVDPNLEAPGGEIDPTNPTFTVAEGAIFNWNLANFGSEQFGTNTVIGSATHNPFLVEALLIASIQAVQDAYGVSPTGPAAAKDWNAELQAVLSRVPR